MTATRDYYEELGVSRQATADEIRKAYRKLARTYHPDVNKADDAQSRFGRITEAYEVLGDPEKRAKYDRFGRAGAGPSPWGGGRDGGGTGSVNVDVGDFGSIFEEIFGGRSAGPFGPMGGGGATAPQRGADLEHRLKITFRTAALGGHERLRMTMPGESDPQTINVKIPAGVETGGRLRVRGKGHSSHGGAPGDLMLILEVGDHPYFRRQGLDLLVDVPITIAEAALGTSVKVPLLTGSAEVKIPPGASSGSKLRLKGKGIVTDDDRAGDLFAVIQIVAPKELSEEGRAGLEELARELKNPREQGPWADTG